MDKLFVYWAIIWNLVFVALIVGGAFVTIKIRETRYKMRSAAFLEKVEANQEAKQFYNDHMQGEWRRNHEGNLPFNIEEDEEH